MPVAAKYEIQEVLDACRYYFAQTGRRITFEYALCEGVNDTDEDAGRLAELLCDMNCHVNLIPVNRQAVALDFKNKLEKNGINVTIRRELGRDIDAACGQLRKKFMEGRQVT